MQRLDEVDDRVVCVCAVGARSARVAQFLNAQGREAVNLDGGLYAWAHSGFPSRDRGGRTATRGQSAAL